jgi:RES domain
LLEYQTPTDPLFRIARGTRPWEFTEWSRAKEKGTFDNRFDDPESEYRVLYAASQLVSCYVETLAPFRPEYSLQAELDAIQGENDYQPLGIVPSEWFENRSVGTAGVKGNYADIYASGWMGKLRIPLQPLCNEYGLEFDLSTLMQGTIRSITQAASRVVYDLGGFHGIYYSSRFAQDLKNWALFEFRAVFQPLTERPVSPTDQAFFEALEILQLQVPKPAKETSSRFWTRLRELVLGKRL